MAQSVDRGGYIDRVAAWFGIGDIDFRLSRTERKRLTYASVFPAIVLLCGVLNLVIQVFDLSDLNDFSQRPSTVWWRVETFVNAIQTPLLFMAVALLFIFSVYPASRALGAWAFLIVAILLNGALCLAIFTALPLALAGRDDFYINDNWYTSHWLSFSFQFSVLAIGYAFLAFRGLSRTQLPSPRRVRIPPSQAREL